MGHAFYFVWPGLGCGQAAAQEPVTNLRVGLPPPSLAGHESPFPPKALRAPRGVSKIRRPCPGLSLSPRALTLPQASSLLQVEAQGLLPPIPHPQRSCGVHGLANSPGGKAMTTQMSRCFLITLCLQRRLWGRCQIVRGGPEPRRQPGALRTLDHASQHIQIPSQGQEGTVWTTMDTGDGPSSSPALLSAGYGT